VPRLWRRSEEGDFADSGEKSFALIAEVLKDAMDIL
jgi:hypothetical protein